LEIKEKVLGKDDPSYIAVLSMIESAEKEKQKKK
jgi:hypothetical protein